MRAGANFFHFGNGSGAWPPAYLPGPNGRGNARIGPVRPARSRRGRPDRAVFFLPENPDFFGFFGLFFAKSGFSAKNRLSARDFTIFGVRKGWLPLKRGWLPLKNGWLPLKNGWLPLKNGWLPLKLTLNSRSYRQLFDPQILKNQVIQQKQTLASYKFI